MQLDESCRPRPGTPDLRNHNHAIWKADQAPHSERTAGRPGKAVPRRGQWLRSRRGRLRGRRRSVHGRAGCRSRRTDPSRGPRRAVQGLLRASQSQWLLRPWAKPGAAESAILHHPVSAPARHVPVHPFDHVVASLLAGGSGLSTILVDPLEAGLAHLLRALPHHGAHHRTPRLVAHPREHVGAPLVVGLAAAA